MTRLKKTFYLPAFVFLIMMLAVHHTNGQSKSQSLTFRSGQSLYIVAFRQFQLFSPDPSQCCGTQPEYINNALDVERKVRKQIEAWQYFRVAEKPSEADFIFLVNLDESSIEGLAIPFEAYRLHFKERFDLDALREAAFGRYLIGPLKLPTVTRLSDRLVKQLRQKVTNSK